METFLKIMLAAAIIMMLVFIWPAYKHWSQEKPQAEKGDWANVMFILGLVTLFVSLLILSVQ